MKLGIKIEMDLRKSTYSLRNKPSDEKKLTIGPFPALHSSGPESGSIYEGLSRTENTQTGFEASVGQGGYCDTCAYNYVGWRYFDGKQEWDVIGFSIIPVVMELTK